MRFYLHYDDIDEAEIAEGIIRSYGIKPEVTTKNIFGFYVMMTNMILKIFLKLY